MPRQYHTGNKSADDIIRILDKNTSSGYRPDDVFSDWLELVEATLEALPAHAQAVAVTGQLAEDIPETQALFARMRSRYRDSICFQRFSEAFHLLLGTIDPGAPEDVLGQIYMAYGYPNAWAGQFFTPLPVARLMAQMTIGREDIEAEIHRRVRAAIEKSPLAEAMLIASVIVQDPERAFDWYIGRLIPACIEHYEPITICDPCCGSGVMFLAAASCIPAWAIGLGLVQFYGTDIDAGCVRMARINCLLHGLNGHGIKWAMSLTELERKSLSEPYCSAYTAAQQAHAVGDETRVAQIAEDLRAGKLVQASLFDFADSS
jgi:hypothetical protein